MPCRFEASEYRGFPVVYVRGDLGVEACPDLSTALSALVEGPQHCAIVDLLDVPYVEAAPLRAVVEAHRLVDERGGALAVVCCAEHVEKLAKMAGVTSKMALFHDIDLAVAFLSHAC